LGVIAWVLRTFFLTALMVPVLSAQAQTSSATVLAATPNPSSYGQSVTLTATVTGASPSGTVTFKDGASTLGSAPLSGGIASLSTSALSVASHSLTAVYAGDINNAGSTSGALVQSVNGAATTLSLTVTPNPASLGQNVTLVARINNG